MGNRITITWGKEENESDTFYCIDGMTQDVFLDTLDLHLGSNFSVEKEFTKDLLPEWENLIRFLESKKRAYERASEFVYQNPNFEYKKVLKNLMDAILTPADTTFTPEDTNDVSPYHGLLSWIERMTAVKKAVESGKKVTAFYG